MSTKDRPRSALRVGGWIPPYEEMSGPVPRPRADGTAAGAPGGRYARSAGAARSAGSGAGRGLLAGWAVLATLSIMGLAVFCAHVAPSPTARPPALMLPGISAIPVIPVATALTPTGPAASPVAAARPARPAREPLVAGGAPDRSPVRAHPQRTGTPKPPAPARPEPTPSRTPLPPAPPPAPALRVGAQVSLQPAGADGYRVRHRDFQGRVDRIGADSRALDRADARFVVRAGLTGRGCVSFESVNYPGRYLRHKNFKVRLDAPNGTALFTADATFCPVARGAATVALRSSNYPDRYVTVRDSWLRLLPAAPADAPGFTVRPPL